MKAAWKWITAALLMVIVIAAGGFFYTGLLGSGDALTTSPGLESLTYYQSGGRFDAKLTWHSKEGRVYTIYRKDGGSYEAVAVRKAKGDTASFIDRNIGADKTYTYTVEQTRPKTVRHRDEEGLTLLPCVQPSADIRNMEAVIRWKALPGANTYHVYRKRGKRSKGTEIASVTGRSYTDIYKRSYGELKDIMFFARYIDPSDNDLEYNVRAESVKRNGTHEKRSIGLMTQDYRFSLEPPVIVGIEGRTIRWGAVPNAEYYKVLRKDKAGSEWTAVKRVAAGRPAVVMSTQLDEVDKDAYYAVQAFAKVSSGAAAGAETEKNGGAVASAVEGGFTLKGAKHGKTKMLFIGDSLTYGAPYFDEKSRHRFSYPSRIHQLTGAEYYNASIPGATYHYQKGQNTDQYRHRLLTDVVEKMAKGEKPWGGKSAVFYRTDGIAAKPKISDFDVVVLAGGTNDYIDDTEIGEAGSSDIATFCGSFNRIMELIEDAGKARIKAKKPPVKVVFVDLFYSERVLDKGVRKSRDATENRLGYTLLDYQDVLDELYEKWSGSGAMRLYEYRTREAAIATHANLPHMTVDNLHFTKYAYALYGNSIAQFLVEDVL